MRFLVLEDDPRRVDWFKSVLPTEQTIYTDTAAGAIQTLETCSTLVSLLLDHDLGGEIFVPPTETNTGSEVARWLAQSDYDRQTQVIIHSLNTPAALFMSRCLEDAGFQTVQRVPFHELQVRLVP